MKSINLVSLYDVLKSNNSTLINAYSQLNGFELKTQEIPDFMQLIEQISNNKKNNNQLMGYYVGQRTQSGICEEFDLLRFSPEAVINIEVKTTWPSRREKCLEQLLSHQNVLRLIRPVSYCFTYIVDTNELYVLEEDELNSISFECLIDSLDNNYIDENLLAKTDLSSMLISPYSEPQRFLNHEYVLTQQQEEIKRKVLSDDVMYSIIRGCAGTGKSLLLMDLARCYHNEGKKVIVFLCRNYASKYKLSQALGITIEEIKMMEAMVDSKKIDEYDVLLLDEAQRIRSEQLDRVQSLSARGVKVVFSLDPLQTLNKREIETDITGSICMLEHSNVYELSNRIRVNEAIDLFSQRMVHINCKKWHSTDFSCIHMTYFESEENCKVYLKQLSKHGDCVIIEPTPYTTKTTGTEKRKKKLANSRDPHSVLGEEFDNVVVLLDEYINYVDIDGERLMESTYPDYYPYDMNHCIYEAVTRAKKSLEIVVLNNRELYVEISSILNVNRCT